MSVFKTVEDVIWSKWFWLPANLSWNDLEKEDEGIFHPHPRDLLMPFLVAPVLLALRYIIESYIATPIGLWYGLSDRRPIRPAPNSILEVAYKKKKSPNHDIVQGLSKQTDLTSRQVERWFRRRVGQDRPTKLRKFTETFWRFCFYFPAFYVALYVMWDKPWLWDTQACWHGFPQGYTMDMYWYYMIELGFYLSLLISLVIDNKRKDFFEMVLHHFLSIALMCASWSNGTWRMGTLVLITHDAVDYLMEMAKMMKYLAYQKLCDVIFVLFTVMWFLSRLLFLPLVVGRSIVFEGVACCRSIPFYYTFNSMFCILQVLHFIWFGFILRIFITFFREGKVDKDDRSETEVSLSESGATGDEAEK